RFEGARREEPAWRDVRQRDSSDAPGPRSSENKGMEGRVFVWSAAAQLGRQTRPTPARSEKAVERRCSLGRRLGYARECHSWRLRTWAPRFCRRAEASRASARARPADMVVK